MGIVDSCRTRKINVYCRYVNMYLSLYMHMFTYGESDGKWN